MASASAMPLRLDAGCTTQLLLQVLPLSAREPRLKSKSALWSDVAQIIAGAPELLAEDVHTFQPVLSLLQEHGFQVGSMPVRQRCVHGTCPDSECNTEQCWCSWCAARYRLTQWGSPC